MTSVTLIAYGDDVHVYSAGDPAADIVYTVAIGANLDATRGTVSAETFENVRTTLGDAFTIVDHRDDSE